ncbi:hypothetical protein MSG28_002831 [Choristoneura fumiferana]|uniref:Uncharacterized protein n=1 Tax=Choristoneura fumiferana TaxID=7141 RepID=A0ACC0JJG9_CHOFU|nr:hypothetical protein MSG28_002831 [Choristoneura fumiferana]
MTPFLFVGAQSDLLLLHSETSIIILPFNIIISQKTSTAEQRPSPENPVNYFTDLIGKLKFGQTERWSELWSEFSYAIELGIQEIRGRIKDTDIARRIAKLK